MMTSTSAFADSRHRDETDRTFRDGQNRSNRNDNQTYRRNDSNHQYRNNNRQENSTYQFRDNGRQNTSSYDQRGNSNYDRRGNSNNGSRNEARRSESFQGRVNRVEHYRGGYNVWIGGGRYPFFIEGSRWSRFPIRVGLNVRLGGYWNPAGYYDVYDVGPYATQGDLHVVVESVDYRRGTLVMRDDVSGSFVTVVMRGNDPRFGNLRQGDYVALSGAWNRQGVFDAYNVGDIRDGRGYGQYDDGRPYGY